MAKLQSDRRLSAKQDAVNRLFGVAVESPARDRRLPFAFRVLWSRGDSVRPLPARVDPSKMRKKNVKTRKRYVFAGCTALAAAVAVVAILVVVLVIDDDGIPRAALVDTQGRTISYLHAGDPDAPRIIYVHGSPGNARTWLDYLTTPIPGFESIAIDRPGFGQTQPADPVPSLKSQAEAIAPFLVKRNGHWPILVGHSLGGTIVCRAAADYADRVGGLVVLSGALDPALERPHWYQRFGEFGIIPALLPRALRNSNRELLPLKDELEDLAPRLKSIACPTAILHGGKDGLAPFSNVDYLTAHLAPERVHMVVQFEERNHLIPWSESAAIRDAIEQIASAGTRPGTP